MLVGADSTLPFLTPLQADLESRAIMLTTNYSKTAFREENFESSWFIKQTAHITTQELVQQLNDHLVKVQAELSGLVNAEFDKFVSLYAEIGNAGNAEFHALKNPILRIKAMEKYQTLALAHEKISGSYSNLENIRNEEIRLGEIKRVIESIGQLEGLLNAFDSSITRNLLYLEAAVHLLSEIKNGIVHCSEFSLVIEKYTELSELLYSKLHNETLLIFEQSKLASFNTLYRIHVHINRINELKSLYVGRVIQPFIEEIIYKCDKEALSTMAGLCSFYSKVLKFSKTCWSDWFQDAYADDNKITSMYTQSVLCPLIDAICRDCPNIFSPGIPDNFHMSFKISFEFLKSLQSIVPGNLYKTKSYLDFTRSWQINVYYQLRLKDLLIAIEELDRKELRSKQNIISYINEYRRLLDEIWSERVLLEPLVPKFVRLLFQAIGFHNESILAKLTCIELGSCSIEELDQLALLEHMHKLVYEYFNELFGDVVVKKLLIIDVGLCKEIQCSFEEYTKDSRTSVRKRFEEVLGKCLAKNIVIKMNQINLASESYSESPIFKSTFDKLLEILNNLAFDHDQQLYSKWILDMITIYAGVALSQLRSVKKQASNCRRLVSVMKESINEADRVKLEQECIIMKNIKSDLVELEAIAGKFFVEIETISQMQDLRIELA